MPRKAQARAKSKAGEDDPVLAAKRELAQKQDELLKKQRALEKMLKEAPSKIVEQRKRDRDFVRINVAAPVASSMPPGGVRDRFSSGTETVRRPRKARRSERNWARVQFLFLCIILFSIVLLIWRSIP